MLGAPPILGRTFIEAEGKSGGPLVVLLSETLWRESFHSDPNIVGQTIKIGGQPRTVVGIMPRSFHFPEQMGPDLEKGVWLPLQPTTAMLTDRGYNFFNVVGALRLGTTVAQLQQNSMRLRRTFPRTVLKAHSVFGRTPIRNY
jgi:putative ABC transport system permease protein